MLSARSLLISVSGLLLVMSLGSCASTPPAMSTPVSAEAASQATQVPTQTSPPLLAWFTPQQAFMPETFVGGIDVGGLDRAAAEQRLQEQFADLQRPIEARIGTDVHLITPEQISFQLDLKAMLDEAQAATERGEAARVPLRVTYNAQALQVELENLAKTAVVSPTIGLISASDSISRSFTYTPGLVLDVAASMRAMDERLQSPQAPRWLTLPLRDDPTLPHVSTEAVKAQVLELARRWDGLVAVYWYDLKDGEQLSLNANTVFSGASVMKVPIALYASMHVEKFSAEEREWLEKALIDSDNLRSNDLLSAAIGGYGTDDALISVLKMTDWLRAMGLEHTYQYMPYESGDYFSGNPAVMNHVGPKQEGPPPYTDADPVLRTTPYEISQVFLWLNACAEGKGELLKQPDTHLSAQRCRDLLNLLAKSKDVIRMTATLPAGVRVERKAGWIEDMQADVGLVRLPDSPYLLAVYVYRPYDGGVVLTDEEAGHFIAAVSRLVYTAYRPQRLDAKGAQ